MRMRSLIFRCGIVGTLNPAYPSASLRYLFIYPFLPQNERMCVNDLSQYYEPLDIIQHEVPGQRAHLDYSNCPHNV